jgi:hypothetical protein
VDAAVDRWRPQEPLKSVVGKGKKNAQFNLLKIKD